MKKFDITKQELYISDYEEGLYIDNKKTAIVAVYEYSFNPDEYFGTEINKPDGYSYLNFATEWNMRTDEISMYYWGDFEKNKNEEFEKKLTKEEQNFFKNIMDKYCIEIYGCNILDLWRNSNINFFENDIQFDVNIRMVIELSNDIIKEENVKNITSAVRNIGNCDIEYEIDMNTLLINFSTYVMSDDEIDAENFCMELLKEDIERIKDLGYKIIDVSCKAKEV